MRNKNKISSRPPVISQNEFISGAESVKQTSKKDSSMYPWLHQSVRADVQKTLSLKIHEEYLIKLKYISDTNGKSQQSIARNALYKAIDDILNIKK